MIQLRRFAIPSSPSPKKPVRRAKTTAVKTTAAAKPSTRKKAAAKLAPSAMLQRLIANVLDDNKAEEIVTIDLAGKSSFADAMIVASGRSARHVVALADHVSHAMRDNGFSSPPIEGKDTGDWVLLDAGDVIVHLFRPEIRQFYNLEKMWSVPAAHETLA